MAAVDGRALVVCFLSVDPVVSSYASSTLPPLRYHPAPHGWQRVS